MRGRRFVAALCFCIVVSKGAVLPACLRYEYLITRSAPIPSNLPAESIGLSLHILEIGSKGFVLRLENRSGRAIYLAHQPLNDRTREFVVHHLQRLIGRGSTFKLVRNPIHFAPRVAVVKDGESLVFDLLRVPQDPGEYQVVISYLDNEDAYRLTQEPDLLSKLKQDRLRQAYRRLVSESFIVENGSDGKQRVRLAERKE